MQVLDAWRRMRGPKLLYEFLLREDTMSAEEYAFHRSRFAAQLHRLNRPPPVPPQAAAAWRRTRLERDKQVWDTMLIEALPAELRRTLGLSALVAFERQWHDEECRRVHEQHVAAAPTKIAEPLFEQSVRHWRRNLKPQATFVLGLWLRAPDEPPACSGWVDSGGAFATLTVSTSWFTRVWAHGLALVDGCFVLRRGDGSRDGSSFPVLAVRWEREGGGISGRGRHPPS